MKRIYYILIPCLLAFSHMAYSRQWISIDGTTQGKAVTMTILESNQFRHVVKVSIHGMHDDQLDKNGVNYHYLSIDDVGRLTKVGAPALPVIRQMIAIPPGSTMSASIDEVKWTDVFLNFVKELVGMDILRFLLVVLLDNMSLQENQIVMKS